MRHHTDQPVNDTRFLLSVEAPLQNALQSSLQWLASWVPPSIRSTVNYYADSVLDSLVHVGQSLPAQASIPFAWEASQRGGPDYWAAHCTTAIEDLEDAIDAGDLTPNRLHQTLLNLQNCVGPTTLVC